MNPHFTANRNVHVPEVANELISAVVPGQVVTDLYLQI